jgi:phenylpyruvate tautomerase PptA (4-oxalocrotonate tautomerase family)
VILHGPILAIGRGKSNQQLDELCRFNDDACHHNEEAMMPLWKIYHPPGAFSAEDKQALAERVTGLYRILPKFYVGVVFQAVEPDSFYVGGEPRDDFVRIWVDHSARTLPDDDAVKARWIAMCDEAIAPYVRDRGLDWEFHIDETPFDLWSIQGIRPPFADSETEKRWRAENRPTREPASAPA